MKRVLLLLIFCISAFGISSKISHSKKLEELRGTKFGKTILNLVNLHSQVQGPIQELIETIEELIIDINTNIDDVEYKYQGRTNEHNSYIAQVSQQIQDADQDIARMIDVIDNLLIPRKEQIENKIQSILENDEHNRKSVDETILLRDKEHNEYLLQVQEDNEAIEAVDDAINLIESLSNPQLLQIKNIKFAFKRLTTKQWNRVQQGPMVQALLQIALSQNFSDQNILREIVDALNEFRNQVVQALNDLSKQELLNQETFEIKIQQLEDEHIEFQKQINSANIDFDATTQKIQDSKSFLQQRQNDRVQYQSQFDLENETYAVDNDIYQNTIGELQRELPIAEQGLSLIKSADFSDIKI